MNIKAKVLKNITNYEIDYKFQFISFEKEDNLNLEQISNDLSSYTMNIGFEIYLLEKMYEGVFFSLSKKDSELFEKMLKEYGRKF